MKKEYVFYTKDQIKTLLGNRMKMGLEKSEFTMTNQWNDLIETTLNTMVDDDVLVEIENKKKDTMYMYPSFSMEYVYMQMKMKSVSSLKMNALKNMMYELKTKKQESKSDYKKETNTVSEEEKEEKIGTDVETESNTSSEEESEEEESEEEEFKEGEVEEQWEKDETTKTKQVVSESNPKVKYTLTYKKDSIISCTCPSYIYGNGVECKHMKKENKKSLEKPVEKGNEKVKKVKSESQKNVTYEITYENKNAKSCTCPAYTYGNGLACKHMKMYSKWCV
jgi:DNA polymerase III gamma/tau subunit